MTPRTLSYRYFLVLALFFFLPTVQAQTWEVVFQKAEKQYAKGKYRKVEKAVKKLRKKHIAKKYHGDPAWYALTHVMEAKGFQAMAEFKKQDDALSRSLSELEAIRKDHAYGYTMGLLKLIDLYNEYGNHRLADSLTNIAEGLDESYLQSELLALEINMRRAFTDVALGNYQEAEKMVDQLLPVWPAKLKSAYASEPVTNYDAFYRAQLLVRLLSAQGEIQRGRGDYPQAIQIFDEHNKQVNKLAASKTPAYVEFRVAEARTYLDWGDIRQARKLSDRLVSAKPPGRLFEKAAELNMLAMAKEGKAIDAVVINKKNQGALIKAGVSRAYAYFCTDFHNAILRSYENDVDKNVILRFNTVAGKAEKILPKDHRLRTKNSEFALEYIYKTQRPQNFPFAEKFFLALGESLKLRYAENSMIQDIFKVNFAGYYLKYSENPAQAYKLLAKAPYKKPLEELSTHHPDYARIVNDLMEYFALIGNFDYPIELTKSVIEAMRANPNTNQEDLGNKMVDLAHLQILGGYYQEAEVNTDDALKLIRKGGERKSENYVKALNNAAYLYGTIGLYGKAEKMLDKSESIYKKIETANQELRLESIVDLAFLYTRMGEYSETEELLDEVVKKRAGLYGPNSRRLIKPYQALGEMYLIRGDYPQAEQNLRKALAITRTTFGDTTLLFAEDLSLLVKLYIELGNYQAALVNATDVLKIREKSLRKNHILFADTYTDLGHIHYYLGNDLDVVDRYYTLAKEITEYNFDQKHPLYAEALKNVASVHIQRGEYAEALKLLDKADDIWREALANLNKSSGEVARIKGDIYSHQGKMREARKEYEKAARYFRKIFSEKHPDYLNTESRLARAYFIDHELSNVESTLSMTTQAYLEYTKTYFPTLSEEEKAKFWNKIKPDFEFYNTVAVQYSTSKPKYLENMYDFALATKGLLLNTSIKTRNSILNSGDSTLINLFKEWAIKKEYLTSTLAKSDEELTENEIDIPKLKEEISQLEKQLSQLSEEFENSFESRLYSWDDVRKALGEDEAAIEIIRYREFDTRFNEDKIRYAALIITADTRKNPELILLENGNDMEGRHFKYQRNTTKYKINDTNSFGVYWEAIYDKIRDKKVVYLSPDGVYNQINVEALRINETEFVIDRMNVRVLNNTKTIAALRSKEARKASQRSEPSRELKALLVGNPLYYENEENKKLAMQESGSNLFVPQLPGTEEEVKTITDLLQNKGWKIESYLGTNATEEQIKLAQNYTLVHIATHGFFDDKPKLKRSAILQEEDDNPLERSGLLAEGGGDVLVKATRSYNIEDGILTAHEAMNLNFEKTELIVLSACETGRGEIQQGEGVFGLQRSFLIAGADAIIMSLFQVSDEVTQKLMVEFYNNWMQGQDKRTAFNNAQLTIKGTYSDPIYWGAFTMIAKI